MKGRRHSRMSIRCEALQAMTCSFTDEATHSRLWIRAKMCVKYDEVFGLTRSRHNKIIVFVSTAKAEAESSVF